MPASRSRLDPVAVQPLLALLIQRHPAAHFTLAQAEEAILGLFRQLGPELVEGLLTGAVAPAAAKKGHHRSVRAAK
ncbi:MAG: hypothetical protein ACYDCO_04335 [Armatimonadota bacterium]